MPPTRCAEAFTPHRSAGSTQPEARRGGDPAWNVAGGEYWTVAGIGPSSTAIGPHHGLAASPPWLLVGEAPSP
jgi:hypothetical protein